MAQALITIGGVALPEPSSYTTNTATIVDSARNLDGKVVGAIVRDGVSKIDVKWRYLTAAQWKSILSCFTRQYGGTFYASVYFFDQDENGWETKDMYVSDRTASLWRRYPDSYKTPALAGLPMGFTDCSLALVEV